MSHGLGTDLIFMGKWSRHIHSCSKRTSGCRIDTDFNRIM